MHVFLPGSHGLHRMYVQPGTEVDSSEFKNPDGTARMFTIEFREGRADVSEEMGRYMLDKGMAQRSPLILP